MGRQVALPPVRYIKPETICIGDTLRITWQENDVELTVTGIVASREHYKHFTQHTTATGHVLIERYGDNTTRPLGARVTLLNRIADNLDVTLFDL